jgi:hypothetical protein
MGREGEIDPIYTYSFICMTDRSEMNIELSRELDFIPKCLKCHKNMIIRYSINNDGDIWMNSAIMHD